ncbi:HAMP domain-containing sensor histidine kinase [Dactylosporangium darangshiense]|uniref:Oxygen sensor histidine kinase NreB n=1 Tax=Dactylosporangium darangshiense TaxID=579108 RepID=A0ABP8CT44_9ACTN
MTHLGLRAKMAASYVLVTAAAVAVVEIVVLVLVMPGLLAGDSAGDRSVIVFVTAKDYASRVGEAVQRLGRLPAPDELQLGEEGLRLAPGEAMVTPDRSGVRIPYTPNAQDDAHPMSLALLLDTDRRIVGSSYPARYPVGQSYGSAGGAELPADTIAKLLTLGKSGSDEAKTAGGTILWAAIPITSAAKPSTVKIGDKPPSTDAIGLLYVQVPDGPTLPTLIKSPDGRSGVWNSVAAQFGVGLLVLLGALPVGAVFGLYSTRRLIGRLRRLAASTVAVADGDYQHRVLVSGSDEVAQLETNFNRMAARLAEAIAAERQLASAGERARIARELHDSISQDLFSLRLLAGGLRRTLPADSPLYPRVEAMEHTATSTMHEMQALLLELRPIALRDAGLIPALEELCQAYRDRIGVAVDADLEPVDLQPAVEHAVLRVIQEALANAVKHAHPNRIALRVRTDDLQVEVSVSDDGSGFDPVHAASRHGMGLDLMRERVAELGGILYLESTPGTGTTIRVLLPRGWPT